MNIPLNSLLLDVLQLDWGEPIKWEFEPLKWEFEPIEWDDIDIEFYIQ
jgi:hypothetical protein